MDRRLAAILAADVVGYTRLMGANELGTLERLKAIRRNVVQPCIKEGGGRVFKVMGDGLLAEFPSVVDAVRTALEIQDRLTGSGETGEDAIRLRIGVHLGDIIVEGSDVYGDGVNLASRVEGLAEPGGICASGAVVDALEGKLDLALQDMGEQQLKNVARPIRVCRIARPGKAQEEAAPPPGTDMADRVSIAVLPFLNMSDDPEQEYFSDGITEDILTELARFDRLFVIARNSSFHYKGRSPIVQEVGRTLGVRYVVEGSVRKAGNRIRITAQLIDAVDGSHVWAERYDRDLEDIFAVQDEVVREIVSAVPGRLEAAAFRRLERAPAENATAYDLVLRAERLRLEDWASPKAVALLDQAIDADPRCARAYAHLANWHAYSILALCAPADDARRLTRQLAASALRIAPNDAVLLGLLSEAYLMAGELDLARRCIEKAIRLNGNHYSVMLMASVTLAWVGDAEDALGWLERFFRHDPLSALAARESGFEVNYFAGMYEEALACVADWDDPPVHLIAEKAAAHALAGHAEEAARLRDDYLARLPDGFTFADHLEIQLGMCAEERHRRPWVEGYRRAGFPV